MTCICYVGIEVSANFQKVLLGIELVMLFVLSIVGPGQGRHRDCPAGSPHPEPLLAQPVPHLQLQRVRQRDHPDGVHLLGLGHRRSRSTRRPRTRPRRPGRAAIFSTVHPAGHLRAGDLLDAGVRRASRPRATAWATWPTPVTCCRSRAARVFGTTGFGSVFYPPAAADGAVLGGRLHADDDPADRADHAVDGGLPGDPASRSRRSTRALPDPDRVHDRHGRRLDRRSTSGLNYTSNGIGVIGDAVIAIGLYIAFYYGLTGFACAWYYRREPRPAARATCGCRASCRSTRRPDPVLPRRLERVAGLRRGHRERLHDVDGAVASTGRSAARS